MATKKLTPTELKSAVKDLKAQLKSLKDGVKPAEAVVKAAQKELALAQKAVDAATTKLTKAHAAAAKQEERINAKLATLQPAEAEAA